MKVLRCLLLVLTTAFAGGAVGASTQAHEGALPSAQALPYGAPPAQAELYSFADIYRLTVSGAALAQRPLEAARGATIDSARAATLDAAPAETALPADAGAPAEGTLFSIAGVKEPQRWLLLLSGLALAGWVARRRLFYAS